MKSRLPKFLRGHASKLLFIPPVVVGAVILVLLSRNRAQPERVPEKEVARPVRVIRAPLREILPRAFGYGTAESANTWQAINEVKGKVIEVHADLTAGSFVHKDDVLIRIDPVETKLTVARLEATISQAEAQLDELVAQKSNDESSLEIEKVSLGLAEKELDRSRKLRSGNAVSAADVDRDERNVLLQRQVVQALNNTLNLFPSRKKSIEANIAVQQAQLDQANLDLEKTEIRAPFDGRVGAVAIEVGQLLLASQVLFESYNVDSIEVEAQVSPQNIRKLLRRPVADQGLTLNMDTMREVFQIDAVVRFQHGDRRIEWPARFERVRENLDPQTRTLGIVFSIDDPYSRAIPGERPPPVSGTFCEVELRSQQRISRIMIPRNALREGHVYVANSENRLARRKVKVSFAQSGFVAIESGLSENEMVVVSDPTPAIEGMLLELHQDDELRQRLIDAGEGIGDIK